ncbi:MAG: class II fumarate hydratase [Armatimonadota bacterium]|jgi:fumarate hydratase class II|nr:class II fumarate hydratase [Armatimonadota bacterium]MDT7972633.1 class II fumarate hydratase [Armatimonadota bacterium]
MSEVRRERDAMGEVAVPAWALWGAQTQRAIENFPISGIRFPRPFIRALGLVKACAARVNKELGLLDERRADAIAQAAQEVAEGKWDEHFPLDIFQTGSGTSTNMNANEVIANRACELLGGQRGDKSLVHPNDHVNLGQSSNDVIPSCIHIAAALAIHEHLFPALERLYSALSEKAKEFDDIVKTGRTHLMDAMPVRLGQEFSGYAAQIAWCRERIEATLPRLYELALGGTAVGTGINTHPEFGKRIAETLTQATGIHFRETRNHFAAQAAMETAVEVSGALKALAVALHKIANDLRWMNSGPQAGLAEIRLPALQPGSSIMPGKINPVIPEAVMMVAMQVFGNDVVITAAAASGNFELNVALPVIAHNLLLSITILANACEVLASKCVAGIVANREHMERLAAQNAILATALTPHIGYDKAAEVVKKAMAENKTIHQVVLEMGLMDEAELDRVLDIRKMTEGGFVAGVSGGG